MRILVAALVCALATSSAGCVVVGRPGHGHQSVERGGCRPSQYWDGHTCRHKGRGHGARKHDG